MRIAAILLALCVAACGFRPLYQSGTTLTGQTTSLDKVMIGDIGTVNGFNLRNALIDRFYHHGYPENAPYVLNIVVNESARNIIIQKNDTTTRSQIVLRAVYTLSDRQSRQVIDTGSARAVASFNNLSSQYTTIVTQSDARDMAIRDLADKITMRMAVVLER